MLTELPGGASIDPAMPEARDGFTQKTISLLAERAGFKCSLCERGTVAAAPSPDASVRIGVAAHICAAAPGGPRFDPSQTPVQRGGIENGVWVCANCARLIDANGGKDYSVERLRGLRRTREERARTEQAELPHTTPTVVDGTHIAEGSGEVTGLDIEGPAIIKPGTAVRSSGTGKVTGTRIRNSGRG